MGGGTSIVADGVRGFDEGTGIVVAGVAPGDEVEAAGPQASTTNPAANTRRTSAARILSIIGRA